MCAVHAPIFTYFLHQPRIGFITNLHLTLSTTKSCKCNRSLRSPSHHCTWFRHSSHKGYICCFSSLFAERRWQRPVPLLGTREQARCNNSFPLLGVPFGVVAKSIVLVGQVAWVYLLASHVIPERDRHQFQCLTFVIFIGSDLSAHSHHHAGSMWSSGRGAASTTLGTRWVISQDGIIHTVAIQARSGEVRCKNTPLSIRFHFVCLLTKHRGFPGISQSHNK